MARADHELIMVQSKHVTRELRQLSVINFEVMEIGIAAKELYNKY